MEILETFRQVFCFSKVAYQQKWWLVTGCFKVSINFHIYNRCAKRGFFFQGSVDLVIENYYLGTQSATLFFLLHRQPLHEIIWCKKFHTEFA